MIVLYIVTAGIVLGGIVYFATKNDGGGRGGPGSSENFSPFHRGMGSGR